MNSDWTIADLQVQAHDQAKDKGFYDKTETSYDLGVATKLALVHSEVSEALEAYRDGGTHSSSKYTPTGTPFGKPEGWGPELADIVIRVADLAEFTGCDLQYWIEAKLAYNATRPHMHGGKKL